MMAMMNDSFKDRPVFTVKMTDEELKRIAHDLAVVMRSVRRLKKRLEGINLARFS